jgi:tetratricopeptide (TPR) repeat protein
MTRVFICYRREDEPYGAKSIRDRLLASKFDVFFDVHSIVLVDDWNKEIETYLASCDCCLAIIGKSWLTILDEKNGKPRLADPKDYVRREIETALHAGKRVIPVLLDVEPPNSDQVPEELRDFVKGLFTKQYLHVRSGTDFDHDMDRLTEDLKAPRVSLWKRLCGRAAEIGNWFRQIPSLRMHGIGQNLQRVWRWLNEPRRGWDYYQTRKDEHVAAAAGLTIGLILLIFFFFLHGLGGIPWWAVLGLVSVPIDGMIIGLVIRAVIEEALLGMANKFPRWQSIADKLALITAVVFLVLFLVGGRLTWTFARTGRFHWLIQRASDLQKLGDWETQITVCNEAIQLKPNNPDGYFWRGNAFFHQGKYSRAIDDYSEDIRLKPRNSDNLAVAYVSRGNAYYHNREYENAITDFTLVLNFRPFPPSSEIFYALLGRGEAYRWIKEFDKSFQDLSTARWRNFDNSAAKTALANLYRLKTDKNIPAALSEVNDAITLNPKNAYAYVVRGAIHNEQGGNLKAGNKKEQADQKFLAALADLNKAIELARDYAWAYSERGLAYAGLGDDRKALDDYDQAIGLNSSYGRDFRRRGEVNKRLNREVEARADFVEALRLENLQKK